MSSKSNMSEVNKSHAPMAPWCILSLGQISLALGVLVIMLLPSGQSAYRACFYQNEYFHAYYFYLAGFNLVLLVVKLLSPSLPWFVWKLTKMLVYYNFFVECEGVIEFIYRTRELEYVIYDLSDQIVICVYLACGTVRWALQLFQLMLVSSYIEQVYPLRKRNRRHFFGWFSQLLADYLVAHYLLWVLANRDPWPEQHPTGRLCFWGLWTLFATFYLFLVRPEVTFLSFSF